MANIYFTNEDGSLKTKEEFTKEMAELYDTYASQEAEDEEAKILFQCTINPETQIDTQKSLNTFNFLTRTFFIRDVITQDTAKEIFSAINLFNRIDFTTPPDERRPIKLIINTYGGDLEAGFTIVSAIRASQTPVYTYNVGMAFSCGFFILINGHKRFGSEYSSYLFHQGSALYAGDAHKVMQGVDYYKHLLKILKKNVLEETNISSELFDQHQKDDWYFDAKKALKLGVIDEIMTDINLDNLAIKEEEETDGTGN